MSKKRRDKCNKKSKNDFEYGLILMFASTLSILFLHLLGSNSIVFIFFYIFTFFCFLTGMGLVEKGAKEYAFKKYGVIPLLTLFLIPFIFLIAVAII